MVDKKIPKGLIPIPLRPKSEQFAIRSAGGKSHKDNPDFKLACKLREMKKRGLDDVKIQWLYDMMTDSNIAALQIVKVMQDILDNSDDNKDKAMASRLLLDWSKMKHGTAESNKKIKIEIQMLSPEEKKAEIERLVMVK